MNTLPNEMSQEILLRADLPSLVQLCSISHYYQSICKDPAFWREKFTREGLPLYVLNGYGLDYFEIYENAKEGMILVQRLYPLLLEEGSALDVALREVSSIEKIAVPGLSLVDLQEELKVAHDYDNLMNDVEALIKRYSKMSPRMWGYVSVLSLEYEGGFWLNLVYEREKGFFVYSIEQGGEKTLSTEINGSDMKDLLFRLGYYDIDFYFQTPRSRELIEKDEFLNRIESNDPLLK